jgi:hypothetical protein
MRSVGARHPAQKAVARPCWAGRYIPSVSDHERLLLKYRERVAGYTDVTDDFHERWLTWCRQVLTYGGHLVVHHLRPESDVDDLLTRAAVHGPKVRLVGGGRNCHANVAKLWIDGDIEAIGTGYALSDDGLWRQHSWGLDEDATVVETKFPCERYVGITLPPGESTVGFALNNYADDIREVLRQRSGRANDIVQVLAAIRHRRAHSERDERGGSGPPPAQTSE